MPDKKLRFSYVAWDLIVLLGPLSIMVWISFSNSSNLQMIVSLEAKGTNAYNRYAMCPADNHLGVAGSHLTATE